MKIKSIITLLAASAALAACQSYPSERPMQMAPRAQAVGVDGAWSDPNGIISTFRGGSFSTRTTDTNQLLASGSYTMQSDRLIEINLTSLVRNTQSKVNCALVTPSQLNCTSDSGSQFTLSRRG